MTEIQLTQGKVALIDDEDYERVSQHKWYAHKKKRSKQWYVRTKIKQKTVTLHRFILDLPKYKPLVDHIDNNGLNNQKSNLRVVTPYQNSLNRKPRTDGTSQYKGVSWHKRDKRWEVYINPKNQKRVYVGGTKCEKTAAKMYNKAAKKYFGEYAWLNPV